MKGMSLAITHFVFGMGTTILVIAFYHRNFDEYNITVPVLGGIWAMVPDVVHIGYALGLSNVYESSVGMLMSNLAISNIFWFHGLFDMLDTTDSQILGVMALAYLLGCLALVEYDRR